MHHVVQPPFQPSHSSLLDRPQSSYGGLAGLMQHKGGNGSGSMLRPRSPSNVQHLGSTPSLISRASASARDAQAYGNMADAARMEGRGFGGGSMQLSARRQEVERQLQVLNSEAMASHLAMGLRHQNPALGMGNTNTARDNYGSSTLMQVRAHAGAAGVRGQWREKAVA